MYATSARPADIFPAAWPCDRVYTHEAWSSAGLLAPPSGNSKGDLVRGEGSAWLCFHFIFYIYIYIYFFQVQLWPVPICASLATAFYPFILGLINIY